MATLNIGMTLCPEAPGKSLDESSSTHHLVPRAADGDRQQLTCKWCGKTEKQLRDQHEAGQ